MTLVAPEPNVTFDRNETAISVSNLRMTFAKRVGGTLLRPRMQTLPAVDGVSFEVNRGEIFGVLGPNGSGKSTLIRAISTLLIPDGGQVRMFGLDLRKDEAKLRRMLNRVSVDAAFYKKLSPRENLLYSARLYGLNAAEAEARALAILRRLGLRDKAFYEPLEEMSRGMQQKVAIARAFLTAPIIVLLDEPTTGLDPKSRRDVQEFVLELRDQHDATIILTTHDMPEAERLCDRIAFIQGGKFVAQGTASELKARIGPGATLEDAFLELAGDDFIKEVEEKT
ncbi:ABC transporter ATP-binding protein [Deinococcus peraridilitoris]|uniref:ABC-type multidrug transport system, ATPase component n=1 Tax=Deinococcus peraridilitoris (strain DSM 19664 / LMG 22246 / CIP 109416 / KR-200) TaxID=937777 RepID=L0A2T5_DEIPD|nr:ABC transporter ATP-binding protein [Deinococcus peraridilitoris]AFZ68193.1 ABC-type multidrug transport system, ATPase component [Deinococcus peraridilitoris DSM 19664]